jgi:hypothetical protein
MIVKNKNKGSYIPYALTGTQVSFKGGALTVDLTEHQRDWPVTLDISANQTGALVIGPSYRYVAQLDIPARSYTIVKGKADDFGFPQLSKIPVPLDMEQVTLTLWAMPESMEV